MRIKDIREDLDITQAEVAEYLNIKQLDKSVYSQKKYPMVKGTIFYKAVSSNENNAYRIYNNRITTEW